jgi:hypothetical protein
MSPRPPWSEGSSVLFLVFHFPLSSAKPVCVALRPRLCSFTPSSLVSQDLDIFLTSYCNSLYSLHRVWFCDWREKPAATLCTIFAAFGSVVEEKKNRLRWWWQDGRSSGRSSVLWVDKTLFLPPPVPSLSISLSPTLSSTVRFKIC